MEHGRVAHQYKVSQLQERLKKSKQQATPFSFIYGKENSNTTRSKQYKKGSPPLRCDQLNQVIQIDRGKKRIWVEPRVTMEALVKATLPLGLIPPVIPELKGITVGGALMGAAAESSSHRWGIFHDSCTQLEFLNGQGELLVASPEINSDLFYGSSGSYGSIGLLVAAELQLIAVPPNVQITTYRFNKAALALEKMISMIGLCDFLDGVIFSEKDAVIITGQYTAKPPSSSFSKEWFVKQLQESRAESVMTLSDYLFRYDLGAFWMGSFLFSLPFLMRYLGQGILNIWPSCGWFSQQELDSFKVRKYPGKLMSFLTRPFMASQSLWGLLHQAEKWIQDHLIIQDLSIPLPNALNFLEEILKDPGTFPLWICPIKGTLSPQILSPHYGHAYVLNFGIYGSPNCAAPMQQIMKKIEEKTAAFGGRKVLYSRSYYDPKSFWQIYPQHSYELLRQKTHAQGIFHDLTEKVLSE